MLLTFAITLVVTFILNTYILIFGKSDLQALKNKISIKKYLREIEDSLVAVVGDGWVTVLKLTLVAFTLISLFLNVLLCLVFVGAVLLGTFGAKKSYEIPSVSNVMNKVATYINRLRP